MYGSINLACFVLSILKSPGFRPRWNHYHWSTALAGFLLCTILSFVISVLYAFISVFLVIGLFIYILSSREKKEWGDAIVGWRLEQATSALLALNSSQVSTPKLSKFSVRSRQALSKRLKQSAPKSFVKDLESGEKPYINGNNGWVNGNKHSEDLSHLKGNNWRPQILLLCKMNVSSLQVTQPHLLDLAAQLKKGRGLIIAVTMIHGDVTDDRCISFARRAKNELSQQLSDAGVKGFTDVCLGSGPDLLEPLRILIQSQGLGPLSPNTVMLNWPDKWREEELAEDAKPADDHIVNAPVNGSDSTSKDNTIKHKVMYVNLLKSSIGCGKAVFVVKGTEGFPGNNHRMSGTIDIWLLMHDGGIVLLLSYLLQRHRVWRSCTLRIFVIAPRKIVDTELTRNNLLAHLRNQRIEAEVKIVAVSIADAMDIDRNRTIRVTARTGPKSILDKNLFVSSRNLDISGLENEDDATEAKEKEEWVKEFCSRDPNFLVESRNYTPEDDNNLFGVDPDDIDLQLMGSTGKDSDLEKPFVLPKEQVFRNDEADSSNQNKHLHLETAKHINQKMREYSGDANLVVCNLPLSRSTLPTEFIDYTNLLTDGLERVILIRGSGNEKITEYDPNV